MLRHDEIYVLIDTSLYVIKVLPLKHRRQVKYYWRSVSINRASPMYLHSFDVSSNNVTLVKLVQI